MAVQRQRHRRGLWLATLVAAIIGSSAVIAPLGAQEENSVSVSPAIDLVDDETVNVQGFLEGVNGTVYVAQCSPDVVLGDLFAAGDQCRLIDNTVGPTVDVDVDVQATFTSTLNGNAIDCRIVICSIVIADPGVDIVAAAPISFLPPLVLSATTADPGDVIDISMTGLSVESASALQCVAPGRCGAIGDATVDGNQITASIVADRDVVLDDGTDASCGNTGCQLGLRLRSPDLREGVVDAVATFFFAAEPALTLSQPVVHEGNTVRVDAVLPNPRGSAQYTQCRADADLSSLFAAGELCAFPRSQSFPAGISFDFQPERTFTAALSGVAVDCGIPDECIFVIEGSIGGFDVFSTPLRVLPRASLTALPSTGLSDGDVVELDTNTLASTDGAVAFSMQCGFLAFYELRCQPTGTVIDDFPTGPYSGEITVERSFDTEAGPVECGGNAVCVIFVLVLDADLNATSGDVQRIDFAPLD